VFPEPHPWLPPAPGVAVQVRVGGHGTLAYLAGWDVHHANLYDRVARCLSLASNEGGSAERAIERSTPVVHRTSVSETG
jgi:hypothetical protein